MFLAIGKANRRCEIRVNPIKNPAEHHKDEATGPEQRRGLSVSQAIGDEKYQAIAFHNRGVERFARGSRDT
jgi:hypothetical protein